MTIQRLNFSIGRNRAPNYNGLPMEQVRGDDGVFCPVPKDSIDDDTLHVDSVNSIKNVPQDD